MKVYIDMIAFYLQRAGGITNVWKELLIRMLRDRLNIVLILQNVACDNIYFDQIMRFAPEVVYERSNNVFIDRYLPVRYRLEKGSRFISTYYRIIRDKSIYQYVLVHDFVYEYYLRGIRRIVHSRQKKQSVTYSHVIICVSENTKNDLLRFYQWAEQKNILVIHNGVSEVYQQCSNVGEIIELERYNNIPFLLYVGSRAKYKRFDIAVKAAGDCGYGLVIVGGGTLQKYETKLLCRYVKDNYLHITGIADETLNLIYNKAFALIYPSEYEGFGIPIIEAQRAGCPVIACKGSSVSEIVQNEDMLMERCTVQEAKKIIYKLKEPDNRKVVKIEGLENAKAYNWEEIYTKYAKELFKSSDFGKEG